MMTYALEIVGAFIAALALVLALVGMSAAVDSWDSKHESRSAARAAAQSQQGTDAAGRHWHKSISWLRFAWWTDAGEQKAEISDELLADEIMERR